MSDRPLEPHEPGHPTHDLMLEALRHPRPVSLERAAELLQCSEIDGVRYLPRVDAARPLTGQVGRPRKKSRWRPAFWQIFGKDSARCAAIVARRRDGDSLRMRVAAQIPELRDLGVPRRYWAGILWRGTLGTFADKRYLRALAKAWGEYSPHAVRCALRDSTIPAHTLGQSEDRIRRVLKSLEK